MSMLDKRLGPSITNGTGKVVRSISPVGECERVRVGVLGFELGLRYRRGLCVGECERGYG